MSLLLMGRMASKPYYYDKLNIRLFSVQELCHVIMTYPLLAVDGLITDGLIDWIDTELKETALSGRLNEGKRAGDSDENLLLDILQSSNYCSVAEVRNYRNMILDLKKMPRAKLLRETGKTFFGAGRYLMAYEKFEETLDELKASVRNSKSENEAAAVIDEIADVLCDMVAVRMLRFDAAGALRLLDIAEQAGRVKRAEEYRYFITGNAILSDEEKAALEKRRRELLEKASESARCREIRELSGLDSVSYLKRASEIIRDWKKEYRRTG